MDLYCIGNRHTSVKRYLESPDLASGQGKLKASENTFEAPKICKLPKLIFKAYLKQTVDF